MPSAPVAARAPARVPDPEYHLPDLADEPEREHHEFQGVGRKKTASRIAISSSMPTD